MKKSALNVFMQNCIFIIYVYITESIHLVEQGYCCQEMKWSALYTSFLSLIILFGIIACYRTPIMKQELIVVPFELIINTPSRIEVKENVILKDYFTWMDSVIQYVNDTFQIQINEYELVHANPWIIDTLKNTDYYYLKERGKVIDDPKAQIAIPKDARLIIPTDLVLDSISEFLKHLFIDVNIPEYTMRILHLDEVLYQFPVRVGKNGHQYLEMSKKDTDLRTRPGEGKIVRVNEAPEFINPKNNKPYKVTRRDDQHVTKLPNIPWIEPEINGERIGQLIHPTTNLATIGKPSSNGCIGLRESDAWVVYYHAPLETAIRIRYDLKVQNDAGEEHWLTDIYPGLDSNIQ